MEIEWLCVYCLRLRPACDEMMIGIRVSSLFGMDKEVDIFIHYKQSVRPHHNEELINKSKRQVEYL